MTGVSPSELLYGRRLRCRMDTWYPDVVQKVENQQLKQKQAHDSVSPHPTFIVGDLVYAENFTGTQSRWLPGIVAEVTGPLSYQVKLESGNIVRRHVDSVRKRYASGDEETITDVQDTDPLFLPESQDSLLLLQ